MKTTSDHTSPQAECNPGRSPAAIGYHMNVQRLSRPDEIGEWVTVY